MSWGLFLTSTAAGADWPFLRGASSRENQVLGLARKDLAETRAGRRLLAEAGDTPVETAEFPPVSGAVYVSSPSPVFIFDASLIKKSSWDLDATLARLLSEASLGLPIDLADADMIARRDRAAFALEYAETHSDFSKRLLSTAEGFEGPSATASNADVYRRSVSLGPGREFERAAADIVLISRDPDLLYQPGGDSSGLGGPPPLWSEVRDFMNLHGPDFSGARLAAGGLYVRISDSLYPAVLFSDAEKVNAWGGAGRVEEALSGREDAQKIQRLALRFLGF